MLVFRYGIFVTQNQDLQLDIKEKEEKEIFDWISSSNPTQKQILVMIEWVIQTSNFNNDNSVRYCILNESLSAYTFNFLDTNYYILN